jgi:hypothetical protein
MHSQAQRAQFLRHARGRAMLAKAQFGMLVNVASQRDEIGEDRGNIGHGGAFRRASDAGLP